MSASTKVPKPEPTGDGPNINLVDECDPVTLTTQKYDEEHLALTLADDKHVLEFTLTREQATKLAGALAVFLGDEVNS